MRSKMWDAHFIELPIRTDEVRKRETAHGKRKAGARERRARASPETVFTDGGGETSAQEDRR